MAKASREYVYGTNPAFEILRAKRRTVYGAWLNQSARDKPRMQKLVKLLEQHAVPMEWVEKVDSFSSLSPPNIRVWFKNFTLPIYA